MNKGTQVGRYAFMDGTDTLSEQLLVDCLVYAGARPDLPVQEYAQMALHNDAFVEQQRGEKSPQAEIWSMASMEKL